MADEEDRQEKQVKDFTEEVNIRLPELTAPLKANPSLENLETALTELLLLEKRTRLAADANSTTKLALVILQICKDCGQWKHVSEQISQLCKKRAQLKKVIQAVIQEGVTYVPLTPSKETKIELIETLRGVSAGKIFVELERARLTRTLCEIKEQDGNLNEACDILQDVAVETIGSMEVMEKADFLLQQLRLCLGTKDLVRAELIARKIKPDMLDKDDHQALKLRYHELMIQLHLHHNQYLAISKAYEKIFRTPAVQADPRLHNPALKRAVIYAVLAPFDSETADLLQRFKREKLVSQIPSCQHMLKELTKQELSAWPIAPELDWRQEADVFGGEKGQERWNDLKKRIVQHNLRVVAGYYKRMHMARLSALLSLSEEDMETYLSEMVSSKQMFAKMDRASGIVVFERKQSPNELLNAWAADVSSLLVLVEKTCHIINKENMLHGQV